ncbi:MAG: ATPase-activating ribosome biosynthesis protein [Watsoniomyces obsoletus]|nr:MAG: ATPase-activating ribosome biosynthesis protein [Watsoniomyces obsoletus]
MPSGIQQQGIFDSMSVPNIDPRSHILGLVGTHDDKNRASPTKDVIEAIMSDHDQRYLKSYPGLDSSASNIIPHGLARQAILGYCDLEELVELSAVLAYRDRAMNVARTLSPVLGVKEFQSHWTWDPDSWMHNPNTRQRLDRRQLPTLGSS